MEQLLTDSPWARSGAAQVYLASAWPVQIAERRLNRRPSPGPEAAARGEDDYRRFMQEHPGKHMVVAIALPDPRALSNPQEARRMEQESLLRAGKRRHKSIGHFPPTPDDPYLRLLFPRAVDRSLKSFTLELYLPSVDKPYRMYEFFTKEMICRGKLEY
jgi:hypothetical protein